MSRQIAGEVNPTNVIWLRAQRLAIRKRELEAEYLFRFRRVNGLAGGYNRATVEVVEEDAVVDEVRLLSWEREPRMPDLTLNVSRVAARNMLRL